MAVFDLPSIKRGMESLGMSFTANVIAQLRLEQQATTRELERTQYTLGMTF